MEKVEEEVTFVVSKSKVLGPAVGGIAFQWLLVYQNLDPWAKVDGSLAAAFTVVAVAQ